MNFIQIKPKDDSEIKKIVSLPYFGKNRYKKILIVNSMLNPSSKFHIKIYDFFYEMNRSISIDTRNVSQVEKTDVLDMGINQLDYDLIFVVVGDCATCTYKASQDIVSLNDEKIESYLVTFNEMESLIDKRLKLKYENKILYFDTKNFLDKFTY
jgi:hypothetical protein